MSEATNFSTLINFVGDNATAATSDLSLVIVLAAICVAAISFGLIAFAKGRYKRIAKASVFALFAALVFTVPVSFANASGVVNAFVPQSVDAHINADSDKVVIDDNQIINLDSDQFIGISSISTEATVSLPSDTKLTICANGKELYNGTIGSTQQLNEPYVLNPDQKCTISYTLNLDLQAAKTLVGTQPIKIITKTDNYEKLHGYVKWEANKNPVEDCNVWFLNESGSTLDSDTTSSTGEYTLWVPTETSGVVKYQKENNIADDAEISAEEITCGTKELPDALLRESVKVIGLITNVNGKPVANCKVEAMLKKSATFKTHNDIEDSWDTSSTSQNGFVQTAYADETESNDAAYTSFCRTYSDVNGNYTLSVPKGYEGVVTYRTDSLVGSDYVLSKTTEDVSIEEPKIVRDAVSFSWFIHDEEGNPLENVVISYGTDTYKPAGQSDPDWYDFQTSKNGIADNRLVPKDSIGTIYYEVDGYYADPMYLVSADEDKYFDVVMSKTGIATDPTIATNLVYNRDIQVGVIYNSANRIEIDPDYADKSTIQAIEANQDGQVYEAWLKPKINCYWQDAEPGHETDTRHYTWTISKKELSDDTQEISSITPVTYTSEELTPSPSNIRSGGYSLTKNVEYSIAWYNNVDARLSSEQDAPVAVITGMGNYTGTVNRKFTINKQELVESSVAALEVSDYLYDGKDHKPSVPTVKNAKGDTLTESTHFTVTYMYGDEVAEQYKELGNYKLVIEGTGNYSGSIDRFYTITKHPMTAVEHPNTTLVYNGEEQVLGYVEITTPSAGATIKYKDSDNKYTLDEPVATDAGEYTIEYQATADNYTTLTGSFTSKAVIAKKSINSFYIEGIDDATYTGLEQQPSDFTVSENKGGQEGLVLANTDYSTTWSNNKNATDAAKVTVTAISNNYTGSCSTTFVIDKAPLTITTGGNTADSAFSYNGQEHTNSDISITGLVNSEVITAQTTGTAKNANISSPVQNDYKITSGSSLLANYNITEVLGSIFVKPKDLTVTPTANQCKYVDKSDPVLTYSCNNSGISNETPAFSGTLSREAGDEVGYYEILQNDLKFIDNPSSGDNFKAANYTMHFQTGVKFEIQNFVYCELTHDASKTWTYDGAAHSITATSTTPNATISYKVGEGSWTATPPTITNVGTLTVKVKASASGEQYRDKEGEFTLEIKHLEVQTSPVVSTNAVYGKDTPDIDFEVIDHPELKESISVNYKSDRENFSAANKTYEIYSYDTEEKQGNYKINPQKGLLTVDPADISGEDFSIAIKSGQTEFTYDGEEKKPLVDATYDVDPVQTLVKDTDYSLTYTRNINAAKSDDDNSPLVNIAGKGNYTGTVSISFTIKKAQSSITLSANSGDYKVGLDGTFTVSSYIGDGQFSVRSLSPEYITADIDLTSTNKTVTVHPLYVPITTPRIRVSISETQNYESCYVDHTCNITERVTKVSFNVDGGSPQVADRDVIYGQRNDAIDTSELPSKEHYVFDGFWYKKDASTPEVQYYDEFGTLTKAWDIDSDNVTLTAHWKKASYLLNFIPDDGLQFKDDQGNVITGIIEVSYGTDYKFTIDAKEDFYLVKNVDKVTHDITGEETSRTTISANEGQYSVSVDDNYSIDAYALLPLTVSPSSGTIVQFHPVFTDTLSEDSIEFYNNTTKIAAPSGVYKWTDVTDATHFYLKSANVSFRGASFVNNVNWGDIFVSEVPSGGNWTLATQAKDSFKAKYLQKGIILEELNNPDYSDARIKQCTKSDVVEPLPYINGVSIVDMYKKWYSQEYQGDNKCRVYGCWRVSDTAVTGYACEVVNPSWWGTLSYESNSEWGHRCYCCAVSRTFGDITLSFDTNGSSSPNPETVTGTYQTTITLPSGDDLEPPSGDYVFVGWNTQPDGNGVNYDGGSEYDLSYSTTLYACWAHPDEIDANLFYIAMKNLYGSSGATSLVIQEGLTAPDPAWPLSYDGHIVVWRNDKTIYVTNIVEGNHIYTPEDCSFLVSGTENAPNTLVPTLTNIDMSGLNTSHTTSFKGMFKGCTSLQVVNISNWTVDNSDDISYMFKDCTSLNKIKASLGTNWSNVTNNAKMFDQCVKLYGGNHTAYMDSRNSGKMARIDGNNYGAAGSTTPEDYFGYFTPTGEGTKTITYDGNNGGIRNSQYWYRDVTWSYTVTVDAINGTISGWDTQKSRPDYYPIFIPEDNEPFEFLYWSDNCTKVSTVNNYSPGDSVASIADGSTIGAVWLKNLTFNQAYGEKDEYKTSTKYYPAFYDYYKLPIGTKFYDSSKQVIDSSLVDTMEKVASVDPTYIAVSYGAHAYGFALLEDNFKNVFENYSSLEAPYYKMTKANISSWNGYSHDFYFADKYMNAWDTDSFSYDCRDVIDMESMLNNSFIYTSSGDQPYLIETAGVPIDKFYTAYYNRIRSTTGHSVHYVAMRNGYVDGKWYEYTYEPPHDGWSGRYNSYDENKLVTIVTRRVY